MGILADIGAISDGSSKLATDQATLNADTAAVAAQQAIVAADASANSAADTQLSNDLLALGQAVFVVNPDGTASFYQYATTPPGYTITSAVPAN